MALFEEREVTEEREKFVRIQSLVLNQGGRGEMSECLRGRGTGRLSFVKVFLALSVKGGRIEREHGEG
jgi:hypothetical protein